jgi:hypothetical protein
MEKIGAARKVILSVNPDATKTLPHRGKRRCAHVAFSRVRILEKNVFGKRGELSGST